MRNKAYTHTHTQTNNWSTLVNLTLIESFSNLFKSFITYYIFIMIIGHIFDEHEIINDKLEPGIW